MTDYTPGSMNRGPGEPPSQAMIRVDYLGQVMRVLDDLDRLGQVAVLRAALEIILADRI